MCRDPNKTQKRDFFVLNLSVRNMAAPVAQRKLFSNVTMFYESFWIEQVIQAAVTQLFDRQEYLVPFGSPKTAIIFWQTHRPR